MATAKKVPPVEFYIQLTLTPSEAETLRFILACVGGPQETARGEATAILNALDKEGVQVVRHTLEKDANAIYFKGTTK